LIHPKAEPEIAVLLKADVAPDASIEEMEKAIGWIAPAIEIIDSRYKDFKFTMPDVVADNCSSAKYEIGEWLSYPIKGVHINEITVKLLINGELKAEGPATAVLGSPLLSLREQQLSLAKAGTQLKKGQLILTGAITVAMMLAPGDLVRVDTNHLGSVSIQCE
jgi:2-oxo-3-hexenedioate decarboxylase